MYELSGLDEKRAEITQMADVAALIRGYGGWPNKSSFMYCNNAGVHSDIKNVFLSLNVCTLCHTMLSCTEILKQKTMLSCTPVSTTEKQHRFVAAADLKSTC